MRRRGSRVGGDPEPKRAASQAGMEEGGGGREPYTPQGQGVEGAAAVLPLLLLAVVVSSLSSASSTVVARAAAAAVVAEERADASLGRPLEEEDEECARARAEAAASARARASDDAVVGAGLLLVLLVLAGGRSEQRQAPRSRHEGGRCPRVKVRDANCISGRAGETTLSVSTERIRCARASRKQIVVRAGRLGRRAQRRGAGFESVYRRARVKKGGARERETGRTSALLTDDPLGKTEIARPNGGLTAMRGPPEGCDGCRGRACEEWWWSGESWGSARESFVLWSLCSPHLATCSSSSSIARASCELSSQTQTQTHAHTQTHTLDLIDHLDRKKHLPRAKNNQPARAEETIGVVRRCTRARTHRHTPARLHKPPPAW
jgi:hypothetical protein